MTGNWFPLALAALCFAAGGLFMKWSAGLSRAGSTAVFLLLFALGALAQAWAMRRAAMGMVYVAVLGLEAAAALLLSVVVLREPLTWTRAFAVLLVLSGVLLMRV